MRPTRVVLTLALLAAPLGAQAVTKDAPDPDKKVAGGGLPAGWSGRTDRASQNIADAKFMAQGAGFHVTSGPAAVYYRAGNTATGPYSLRATFTQAAPAMHPEAYGLIFGGARLDQADQSYGYFLVRQNGQFTVKHRAGDQVHTLVDWSSSPAIKQVSAGGPAAVNALEVRAGTDSTRFFVNGTQVTAVPKGLGTDGVYGLRVNHNLDVQIDGFGVTKGR